MCAGLVGQAALANPLPGLGSRAPKYAPGHLGAVASESSICSDIGIELLRQGGNAADAVRFSRNFTDTSVLSLTRIQLVGTVFCIGVVGMYHSGIGGGGFMLARASNGSYEDIDFRETMPAAGFQDMYNNNTNASIYGGMAR